MKSQANGILDILEGFLTDIQLAYPECRWVSRDKERLTLLALNRGLGLFTLDLPNLDAVLKNGLESGRLVCEGPCSHKVSSRIQVPRLFRGLWLRIFSPDSCLREDADVNAIMFLSQVTTFGKRMLQECSPTRLEQAVKEYFDIEKELPAPSLSWTDDFLGYASTFVDHSLADLWRGPRESVLPGLCDWAPDDAELLRLLSRTQRFSDCVARAITPFHGAAVMAVFQEYGYSFGHRHGPGAVADRSGTFNKYTFLNWSVKLDRVFPYAIHGKIPGDTRSERPGLTEVPSKLLAVPKTAKGPRLIAAEPTEHQWCQQLIKDFLVFEIDRVFGGNFVDFRSQEKSQNLARRSSLVGDTVTVDLSSASDRLSCYVIERIFRSNPNLLYALHACRTRWIRDDVTGSKRLHILKKYASQGTATTFPVQTLVFLILVLSVLDGETIEEKIRLYGGRVQVFGDDIIMPRTGYDALKRLFPSLSLKINVEKSFSDGSYRESCGMDAFKGYDITPVKPQRLSADGPQSRASLLDMSNNLFIKGYWHAAVKAESIGRSFFPKLPIVGRDMGVIGRASFVGYSADHLFKRWNKGLQRFEVRSWTFRSKSRRKSTNDYPGLFQYFTEMPEPTTKWVHGLPGEVRTSDGTHWEALACN